MEHESKGQPSFSARRRWIGRLRVVLGTTAVVALVVMANYLAVRHPVRWYVTPDTELRLSPQTLSVLRSITNEVRVTVFYDREDPMYSMVTALLREYELINPRIRVRTVDYVREAGAAQQVFAEYQLAGATNKNLVLFDCQGRVMRLDGRMLAQFTLEPIAGGSEPEFARRPVAFHGERAFTSALLAVTMSRPLRAFFLTGHEEHDPDSAHETVGYQRFANLLRQNCIVPATFSLEGTNLVPEDCHLLIVAGPLRPLPEPVLQKLDQYLQQGGRMLVLLNSYGLSRASGLESLLARWGVEITLWPVSDRDHTITGQDLKVIRFGRHPVVEPLLEGGAPAALHLWRPRAVSRLAVSAAKPEGLTVTELAYSGERSVLMGAGAGARGPFSLAVAVEKGAVPGVVTSRGNTRIVVVGDSFFLANQLIESVNNADFGAFAVNWLLDRQFLLHPLSPRPVREFRVTLSARQMRALQWTFLAGMPAGLLLIGLVIWWRRRS
ncbi:MAG: Gldg family protein [Verrucomicrobiota bacterium]|nr:Gldg family protein [Limisphaera sp.]MDW8382660.1 Gldg family protein [Verrucomicrobiota bacterium]